MPRRAIPCLFAALLLTACERNAAPPEADAASSSPPAAAVAQGSPGQRLQQIVEAYYDSYLELNPLQATFIDDHRYDDRLANDIGPEAIARAQALEREYLDDVQAIDAGALDGQDRLTYEVFLRDRRSALEGYEYPSQLLPVNQFFSLPSFFARLGSGTSVQPFDTYADYQNFLRRAADFAVWMDQAVANMRQGMEQDVVQPRVVIEKTIPQLESQITDDWTQSLFHRPVEHMPDSFTAEQRASITADYEQAVTGTIIPAYRRLRDFLHDEYLPHTRATVGMGALPNGGAWYDYLVKTTTTTDLTPEQIHQIGLDEVARIHTEMEEVKAQVGFKGSLQDFFQHLRTDPQYYYTEPEQLLDAYRALKVKVEAAAPKLFSLRPKADFEIRPVEEFRAKAMAAAQYQPASPDGSRPGIFYVNTYDLKARPTYNIEAIFLHEAEPGHHFQISIQQELEGLPRFRRFGGYTAYVEGWGLYAETLGKELGLYTDPYQYYGKLAAEMLRAIRLVTDTGMHYKGWTREQALQYMLDNSSMPQTDAVAEIERYIAIPSQALAYKVGQLEISKLRAKSEQALGDAFDIREFHARILEDGALPLDVLDAKIDRWLKNTAMPGVAVSETATPGIAIAAVPSAVREAIDELEGGPDGVYGADLDVDEAGRQSGAADHVFAEVGGDAGALLGPGHPQRPVACQCALGARQLTRERRTIAGEEMDEAGASRETGAQMRPVGQRPDQRGVVRGRVQPGHAVAGADAELLHEWRTGVAGRRGHAQSLLARSCAPLS